MNPITASKAMIYLFSYAPTAWDAKKFGFDILHSSGVNLHVLDLSALVSTRSETGAAPITAAYIEKITSYELLEKIILKYKDNSIFIDNINGLSGFQWAGRQIFKLFKKYNVQYYVLEVGSLPILATEKKQTLAQKLKKALQLKKLFIYLKWRLGKATVNYQWRHYDSYQLPAKVFTGNSETRQHYLAKYNLTHNDVVSIHSFDYDRFLDYQRNGQPLDLRDRKICVFVDQMLATHPDFGKIHFSPVTVGNYFPALNQFFDYIENTLGLTVVIAACPRVNYENTPELFGGRAVFYYQAVELVAQSALVLMHTSTAVSFPVLFNKPIIFMKTKEMANAPSYLNLLENMAAELKLPTICIDNEKAIQQITPESFARWPTNYDEYKFKYVMSKDAGDNNTWEILMAEFYGQSTTENSTEAYA